MDEPVCVYCGLKRSSHKRHAEHCPMRKNRSVAIDDPRPSYPEPPVLTEIVPSVKKPSGKPTRILVIPDLHAPFHEESMLDVALGTPADVVVVMGDVLDMYAVSRFTQYEKVTADDEWTSGQKIMQRIADKYPEVHVITGNHDKRLERQVRSHVPLEWVEFILKANGGSLNPLKAICREFPNVRVVENVIDSRLSADWFVKIGDCIFSHAEKYSRVPGSALRGVEEWFSDFEHVTGVTGYKVVVQAHTHSMCMFPWRADKWLVECGCLCKQHGYQYQSRISGRPQRRGFVTMSQTDGVTDVNSIRLISTEGLCRSDSAETVGRGA